MLLLKEIPLYGGGASSIHINGGQYKNIFIEKQDGRVRIVAPMPKVFG